MGFSGIEILMCSFDVGREVRDWGVGDEGRLVGSVEG